MLQQHKKEQKMLQFVMMYRLRDCYPKLRRVTVKKYKYKQNPLNLNIFVWIMKQNNFLLDEKLSVGEIHILQ